AADERSLLDVLLNQWKQRGLGRIWHYTRDHISAALDHPKYSRLVRVLARTADAVTSALGATNVGFVNLDMARQAVVTVHDRHVLANLVTHPPRSLIRH